MSASDHRILLLPHIKAHKSSFHLHKCGLEPLANNSAIGFGHHSRVMGTAVSDTTRPWDCLRMFLKGCLNAFLLSGS